MKKAINVLMLVSFTLVAAWNLKADTTWMYTVQISAAVQSSPPQISLSWPQDQNGANNYTVYRKGINDSSWGSGTTLPGSATSYVDNNVSVGAAYEYQIVKAAKLGYSGYGYIYAGIDAPLIEGRGKVVLLVDNTVSAPLATELTRLQSDLTGDGWVVLRHDVGRSDSPSNVRELVKTDYNADRQNVKAVFIFGHVPILRSGNLNIDGHQARKQPADGYYGDMDGNWSDPSYLPSDVELMVGRVDFFNMPGTYASSAWPSEVELLRNYLNKDHNWRHKLVTVPRRGLIGNRFGDFNGEGFAASGFRNLEPFVGHGNTDIANEQDNAPANQKWSSMLAAGTYLWAYGCGGGSYTSMSGLGLNGQYGDVTSYDIVGQDAKAVFFMMFGSWLGEWDGTDDIMRAALATRSLGLTCSWAGRPHWYYHHMGLGEVIGYSARLSMNNDGSNYKNQVNNFTRGVHIALMGDPTLRMHPVAPASNLRGAISSSGASLSWNASTDSVLGYNVYRASSAAGPFSKVNSSIVTGTSFTDTSVNSSRYTYMVRAVKLENTPSGTYNNPSQGTFVTLGSGGGDNGGGTVTDTVAPSVSITSPANGATVSGNAVNIAVTASDNVGVVGVQFKVDNVNVGSEQTAAPYQVTWNSTNANNGVHSFSAIARDAAGNYKTSGLVSVTVANNSGTVTNTPGTDPTTNTPPVGSTSDFVWVDDSLPAGAQGSVDGDDAWNWVANSPAPFSGTRSHQSSLKTGRHEHIFNHAWNTLNVKTGEYVFSYVYLDPANPPSEVMLQWCDGSWEHRAYWGANNIPWGTDKTAGRRYMGPLPAVGQWVRLEVPAAQVNLEGRSVQGMSFALYNGRAAWDTTGKASSANANPPSVTNTPPVVTNTPPVVTNTPPVVITNTPPQNTNVVITPTNTGDYTVVSWVDDALPAGASPLSNGDSWHWISSTPAPFSGTKAHQSDLKAGLHEHFFNWAYSTLNVKTGETLFSYVYLDPANPPSELMLHWNNGNWEHRAYWGANKIGYGTDGTAGRRYMGPLPPTGKWVRLDVPAQKVNLEGSSISGMTFSLYDGQAVWDLAGKLVGTVTPETNTPPVVTNTPPVVTNTPPVITNTPPVITNTPPVVTNTPPVVTNTPPVVTNMPPVVTNTPPVVTNTPPAYTNVTTISNFAPVTVSVADYVNLRMPKAGDHTLHLLSPTMLEVKLINVKQPDPARVSTWDLVDSSYNFRSPGAQDLSVLVDGRLVPVQATGFRRRALYAPLVVRDLRLDNSLFLQLASPVAEGQKVEVKNPTGNLWSSSDSYVTTADALRFSPAIHVNQEGYVPSFPKKAMVGYYLGNLGEMSIDPSAGFKLVDATSGNVVFQGSLKARPDVGFSYTPAPYTKVFEADFSSFTTPGDYRLCVPGMGASLPFLIHDGIAMDFARAYALGLYHQRCGTNNVMPFTRFTHDPCHTAQAEVPLPESSFPFTWRTISGYTADYASTPGHTAPPMKTDASSRYPFVNKGKIDVSGGHHDAGDYSKYTINSTRLIHYLMIAVDAFQGVADLDNLGLPESGDGISDIMQEAKWEADFLAKMQDADGGFYFLVYPRDREYESNVTPDAGDTQVVWPKTTSVTAASVAALAQCASSPRFKQQYPAEAALYMKKAQLGWKFLTDAIARYGKDASYQKITHYGNEFIHNDELAWAACEMFLATGDSSIHQTLKSWFDPSDPNTIRWGWWRMAESYGSAIRSYAFAARSGRLAASQLDASYLAKCENQILLCAQEDVDRSAKCAYGSSFPLENKSYRAAGWYFSTERAFDIAVGYQINPKPEFLAAILENMNYEGGCNPANISYITGLGWKRQREIVHQYSQNDRRILPLSGIPLGNIQAGFSYTDTYKSEMGAVCFPQDGAASAPYPYYDRWSDTFNVTTEFVNTDQARSLATIAFVAALTPLKSQLWKPVAGQITCPGDGMINSPRTASIQVPGMDINGARVVWEARDQEPAYGASYTFTPTTYGAQWIEAEVQWPDGRRVYAVSDAFASNSLPTVSVAATTANASETGPVAGVFTFTRTGSTAAAMTVNFQFGGTASKWFDYKRPQGDIPDSVVIPAGAASVTFTIVPISDGLAEGSEIASLTISPSSEYNLNQSKTAAITITD